MTRLDLKEKITQRERERERSELAETELKERDWVGETELRESSVLWCQKLMVAVVVFEESSYSTTHKKDTKSREEQRRELRSDREKILTVGLDPNLWYSTPTVRFSPPLSLFLSLSSLAQIFWRSSRERKKASLKIDRSQNSNSLSL